MDKESSDTILIIDDDLALLQSLTDFLEDLSYKVLSAENGLDGVEIFKEHRPDLVMVDLRMPDIDGFEVIRKIKELSKDAAIVVVSGTGKIEDSIKAIRLGASDFIEKPVSDMDIISHVVAKELSRTYLEKANKDHTKNLEKLVGKRTHELTQVNLRLEHINARLRRVVETTKGLSACTQIDTYCSQFLSELAHHMGASGGSFYLVESNGLRCIDTLDPGHAPEFIEFPLAKDSVLFRVMEEKIPVLIENIEKEKNIHTGQWNGYNNGSLLSLPIADETGQIVGAVSLHNKDHHPFVEEDKEIGAILASYGCESLRTINAFESLQQNERLLSTIADNYPNSYVSIIEKDLSIKFISGQAFQKQNIDPLRFQGASLNELFKEQTQTVIGYCKKTFKGDETEFGLFTDNMHQLCRTVPLIEKNGEINQILIVTEDITEKRKAEIENKELEKQLIQAQKMEAVAALAGGIAHDFNNVLSTIIGPVSIIEADLQTNATITKESIEKYITMIHHSAVRASEMVQQLFSISQDKEQEAVMIDLNFCVKHVVKLTKTSFDKSITIKPVFHDKPAKIMGNPMQIEQVLLNLFINAAHSMTLMRKNSDPWGGILDVSVSSSSLTKESDQYWQILIKDTGVGIPETLYSKIFSPFFTTKAAGKGTGLGLSMVQNIVKQHQGHIIFDSTPGKGTEFHLHFPVSHDKSKEQASNKETDIIHGTGTVMIVDDETILVNTVCTMLTICGYNPISASNGKQALKIFQNNFKEINCVILDLSMPYLSGIEIFNQMKTINPEVRVILTTGYNTDERINRMLDLGAKGVLKKPFNIAALSNIVGKTFK